MSKNIIGLQYPSFGPDVPQGVQDAFRNIFDNLFYLRNSNVAVPDIPESVLPTLDSGVYTPRMVIGGNLDVISAQPCQWMRVGKTVWVSGSFSVDPTAGGSAAFDMTLPIPTKFTLPSQCAGTAFAPGIAGQGAAIYGKRGSIAATVQWIAVDTTLQTMYFSLGYLIN